MLHGEPEDIPLIAEAADTAADTALTYDRTEQRVCYASNDIPESWIVNLQAQTVERYHDPVDDEYRERRTLEREDTVAPRFDDAPELAAADLPPTRPKGE